MRILPFGATALLAEVPTLGDVLALHAALAASRPDGVVDLVPAARTVLVRVDPEVCALAAAKAWIERAEGADAAATATESRAIDIDVAYDGADLADTAALLGLSADELVARHTSAAWRVAFTGFAPGFGYLVSDDWPFDVPRLASPRTRVPAGSVGVAGEFSGAYPRDTPGGWRLLGTTAARLFDPDADAPALLTPGDAVRFRAVRSVSAGVSASAVPPASAEAAASALPPASAETGDLAGTGGAAQDSPVPGGADAADAADAGPRDTAAAGIRVVEAGLLATLQDLGRPGAASIGVAASGALDRASLRLANRLVGNPESAACIEVTMGGLRAVATADAWAAVTGAWGPVTLAGRPVDPGRAFRWGAGEELWIGWFAQGARAYLAVRGGWDGPVVLGSRATDLMAGLGPRPLAAGSEVAFAHVPAQTPPAADIAPWTPPDAEIVVELAPGPRSGWFTPDARHVLYDAVWTVSGQADRVGIRLDGPELERIRDGEVPSEGMVPGALQVPPSGRPTVLMADGPVTGGYPVIAVATDAGIDAFGQARPGTRVRFRHARVPA
ncbi:urea amidolyase family protein [Microbacter sp. GSS18]|nr:urea amidolyase family protein [Microbacter sp. GSS18]